MIRRAVEKAMACLATATPTEDVSEGPHTPFLVPLSCMGGSEPRLLRAALRRHCSLEGTAQEERPVGEARCRGDREGSLPKAAPARAAISEGAVGCS